MNTKNFIRCTDKDTIEKLKSEGFQVVSETNGITTFVNDTTKKITFDTCKLAYTNVVPMS